LRHLRSGRHDLFEGVQVKTEVPVKQSKPELFEFDLPDDRLRHYLSKPAIAIDTETRGLNIYRDRLCLVQLSDEEGLVSLVKFPDRKKLPTTSATNLKKLLEAPSVLKLFHYARFDVSVLKHYLDIDVAPIWCTKIASKLVRTYTDQHSLKYLTRELLGIELDKTDQMSDWAKPDLSESQLEYAANDVRYLNAIYEKLKGLLEREGRLHLAEHLYKVLPTICELDRFGYNNIFDH